MGCMVGVRDPLYLRQKLPFVDVFMPPSEPEPMVAFWGMSKRRPKSWQMKTRRAPGGMPSRTAT
jgi:hypothetical protein